MTTADPTAIKHKNLESRQPRWKKMKKGKSDLERRRKIEDKEKKGKWKLTWIWLTWWREGSKVRYGRCLWRNKAKERSGKCVDGAKELLTLCKKMWGEVWIMKIVIMKRKQKTRRRRRQENLQKKREGNNLSWYWCLSSGHRQKHWDITHKVEGEKLKWQK